MTNDRLTPARHSGHRVSSSTGVFAACLLMCGVAGSAGASQDPQDGPLSHRAEALAAERELRAGESAAPDRSNVERFLYWYDNQYVLAKLFAGWHGVHLAGGNFPAGAGYKFGVGYDLPLGPSSPDPDRANRIEINTRAAYSTRGYSRISAGLNLHNLGGVPFDLTLSSQYYEFPQEDFFGIGSASVEDNRTNYLLNSIDSAVAVRWQPRFLDVGAEVAYLTPRVGQGTDPRHPSTESIFNPADIPGFVDRTDFVRGGASVAFDWRDNPLHPHAGGRYGATVTRFLDRDLDAFSFDRFDIDLQQYVPLPDRYRLLALHAAASVTDARAGQEVPFYFQPTLGGAQALRGFRESRFRDRNSLLLSAEYRWEAWWAMDPALFVDAGTVAPHWRDLSLRDLDVSYGVGFRVHSNSAFTARLDFAFCREGFVPLLRFEHVF